MGWTVGNSGVILKTTDGGTTWVAQTSGTTKILEQVFFIDANTGWIAGHNNTVLLTTDGGTTWTAISILSTASFNSISFSDASKGIICGFNGKMYRSADGGNTWSQESTGTTNALFDAEIIGFAVGSGGKIIKYECTTGGCDILQSGKLKEDGTQKLTEDGNNKIQE